MLSSYYQQALSTQNMLDEQKSTLASNYENVVYSMHGYLKELYANNPELFSSLDDALAALA